ncbi:Carboxy-terminal domain (CTD) phosphatase, partial [Gonapodya sp. JEL0774]
METRRDLFLPAGHVPAKVVRILARAGQEVKKSTPLFVYRYSTTGTEGEDEEREEYVAPCAGTFDEIGVFEGETIRNVNLAVIVQPCGHPISVFGMCGVCGKELSSVFKNADDADPPEATISVDHNNAALKVTKSEAMRLEKETTERLLRSRKLSLVLDLDQTIIHATVDPTVGEWMEDPTNPNYPVLQGVHRFVLPDHPAVYYVKMRPHLQEFLRRVSKLYELHVYTMGTRTYADEIARKVDPEGSFFGERVLSRDESGSFTAKSLLRLFPFDQSMVAVVDDRADVWNWSQNLIKIRPYEFFLGIGDINSAVYEAARN